MKVASPSQAAAYEKERKERQKSPKLRRVLPLEMIVEKNASARRRQTSHEHPSSTRLTDEQKSCASVLEDAADMLRDAREILAQEPLDEAYLKAVETAESDFDKALGQAIRANLLMHPLVKMWLTNQRTFGEWDNLRRFKRLGLERGVKRPIAKADFWLLMQICAEIEKQGLNLEKVPEVHFQWQNLRRSLLRKLRLDKHCDLPQLDRKKLTARLEKMSRQRFHQLCHDLLRRFGIIS